MINYNVVVIECKWFVMLMVTIFTYDGGPEDGRPGDHGFWWVSVARTVAVCLILLTSAGLESAQLPRHTPLTTSHCSTPLLSPAPHTPDGESGRYASRHWSGNFSNLSLTNLLKHRDLRGIPLKDCQTSSSISLRKHFTFTTGGFLRHKSLSLDWC